MNEEQRAFVESGIEAAVLYGIPGSGKTTTVLRKICRLARESTGIAFDARSFLLLSFSRRDVQRNVQQGRRENAGLFDTRNIVTIHSLAGRVLHSVDHASESLKTAVLVALEWLRANPTADLARLVPSLAKVRVIFVDEAQDLSGEQYAFVCAVGERLSVPVTLIGDADQSIYQFQGGSDIHMWQHPGQRYHLVKNYRSTPQIVRFASHFRPSSYGDTPLPPMVAARTLPAETATRPVTVHSVDIADVYEYVGALVRDLLTRHPPHEIAVVGPMKKCRDSRAMGLSLVANWLADNGVPVVWMCTPEGDSVSTDAAEHLGTHTSRTIQEGRVNIGTVHSTKGSEFAAVVVLHFNYNTMVRAPTRKAFEEHQRLWYVAMTRARDELHLMVSANMHAQPRLATCDPGNYETRLTRPLTYPAVPPFDDETPPLALGVTKYLNQLKEAEMLELERLFAPTRVSETQFWTPPADFVEVLQSNELCKQCPALFGLWAESVFHFMWSWDQGPAEFRTFVTGLQQELRGVYCVPPKSMWVVTVLRRLFDTTSNRLSVGDMRRILRARCTELSAADANRLGAIEGFLREVEAAVGGPHVPVTLADGQLVYRNDREARDAVSLDALMAKDERGCALALFRHALYLYQTEQEARYLIDHTGWEQVTAVLVDHLLASADALYDCCGSRVKSFQHSFKSEYIPLCGKCDILATADPDQDVVVELKFTTATSMTHMLQVCLYQMLQDGYQRKRGFRGEVWNLRTGVATVFETKAAIDNVALLKHVAAILKCRLVDTFWLYDLETDGLIPAGAEVGGDGPEYPRILQRHVYEPFLGWVGSTGLVRSSVPVPAGATAVHGITTAMAAMAPDTMNDFEADLSVIGLLCQQPVLAAHNGARFDNLLLRRYFPAFVVDRFILADTKQLVDPWLRAQPPDPVTGRQDLRWKLQVLYDRTVARGVPVVQSHRADGDVEMLTAVLRSIGALRSPQHAIGLVNAGRIAQT